MKFSDFKPSHVEEASMIIGSNYKRSKEILPILPEKFCDNKIYIDKLRSLSKNNIGIVAMDCGRIAGFMTGFTINSFKGLERGVLSMPLAHAVADGYDSDYLYNELYRYISASWVKDRCYTHGIVLGLNDKNSFDSWGLNGFGMLVIDAICPLNKVDISNLSPKITIRNVEESDLAEMEQLFLGMDNHLTSAPIFLYRDKKTDSYMHYYTNWLSQKNNHLWIAEIDNSIVGYLKTNTQEINLDELDDGYTMGINGAYVLPEFRGLNIMARLLNAALDWARDNGLKRCSTDFESANIEGRRFWLKHFTPCYYSFIRKIDQRSGITMGVE